MKNIFSAIWLLFLLLALGCAKEETPYIEADTPTCQRTKLENQHIIHWKSKATTLLQVQTLADFESFKLEHKNQIEFIEPNYLLTDPNATSDFNFVRSASSVHNLVNAPTLWQAGYQGQGIVVAVIDTGINLNHPQLITHLAINEIESRSGKNNIDDDGNGFIDDIYGWNFVTNKTESIDEHGHGTAMAGIITGSNYNRPSLSMAPLAKILPVDFMNETGGTEYDAKEAMAYAISRKVHIINNSWSINCSQLLKQAFIGWKNENVIFVNASGNSPVDVVLNGIIPSSLDLPNSLNVGSLDESGHRSSFSGFGTTVKIFAPGEFIPTIYPSSGFNHSVPTSGTSVSAAIVSGAAALLWSAYPEATAAEIVYLMTETTNQEPLLEKVLDLKKAYYFGRNLIPRTIN